MVTAEATTRLLYFFILKVFTNSTYVFYQKITFPDSNGLLLSLFEPKITIIDEILKGTEYDYLRPKGTITCSIDKIYDVPRIELAFDGWYVNSVRLRPKRKKEKV